MKIVITEQQFKNIFENNSKEQLTEKCWSGYKQKGMKTMFGKRYPNCVKNESEDEETNEALITEAEYQGRKVQLGKIMQGDIKKSKVYVKNDKGKVVKVNFGFGGKSAKGKIMRIKKNNPERRKSFRARHNCDTPGPRWKPRYWACRTW